MNSYIISHEGTRNAKQMLMTNPRKRVLGLPWPVAAEGLCPRCRTDLVFPCPPKRPGKCTQSQLWHPVLCCAVLRGHPLRNAPGSPSGMLRGGRGKAAHPPGSGRCRQHRLWVADLQIFLPAVLCLLLAGGKVGSPQMTSQGKDCVFRALLQVGHKGKGRKHSNGNFFSFFNFFFHVMISTRARRV